MRASDKPKPSGFLKGKQNVPFYGEEAGAKSRQSRVTDPGAALGGGSQKQTSFEFNRTVTVSLYKCQLNINGIFSGD